MTMRRRTETERPRFTPSERSAKFVIDDVWGHMRLFGAVIATTVDELKNQGEEVTTETIFSYLGGTSFDSNGQDKLKAAINSYLFVLPANRPTKVHEIPGGVKHKQFQQIRETGHSQQACFTELSRLLVDYAASLKNPSELEALFQEGRAQWIGMRLAFLVDIWLEANSNGQDIVTATVQTMLTEIRAVGQKKLDELTVSQRSKLKTLLHDLALIQRKGAGEFTLTQKGQKMVESVLIPYLVHFLQADQGSMKMSNGQKNNATRAKLIKLTLFRINELKNKQ